jgi:hypothetical protein
MTPTASPDPPILLPAHDEIGAAIEATNERALLLRGLPTPGEQVSGVSL